MELTLVLIVSAVLGLLIGSFLTVVVDRVPDGRSVVQPPSACGECGHRLSAPDLVPIVSWFWLRGRCRHCGHRIGIEPLVLELTTAVLFVLFGFRFGADPILLSFWIFAAALVALVWIDLHIFRLPREITYTAGGLSLTVMVIVAVVNGDFEPVQGAVVGALIALGLMGLVYIGARGGMGDGDVRLAPLLGLQLGYLNPAIVPIGLFLGFLFGAVVGVAAMMVGKAGRKTALPFGPFLAAGAIAAVWVGQPIVDLIWHH